MSIALATITLIFLLTPGLLFWRFYYSGEFSHQYFKASFSDYIVPTLVPSILIHVVLYYCLIATGEYRIDTRILGNLFSGTTNNEVVGETFTRIHGRAFEITSYFAVGAFVGAAFGLMSKLLVRKMKWDRTYKFLRFQNEWHYLFSGEIVDFPNIIGTVEEIAFTYIDALVDTKEGSVIYTGKLEEYILNKDGGIDRIYLTDVRRRYMKPDGQPEEQVYYNMPGKIFVIFFKSVINLNVTYYDIVVNDDDLSAEMEHVTME